MNRAELLELIANGENSGVEFKEAAVSPESLAREIVAFANFRGGRILIGVGDERSVTGIAGRPDLEEWVANVCRDRVRPALIPYYEEIEVAPGQRVAVVTIEPGPFKPYRAMQRGRETALVRVGSTSREASVDEIARMAQAAGALHFEVSPIPGTGREHLSPARLQAYFTRYLRLDLSALSQTEQIQELRKAQILTDLHGRAVATLAGLLLFGRDGTQIRRFVPQSGVTAVAFAGPDVNTPIRDQQVLTGPLPTLFDADGNVVEYGLIDRAVEFIQHHTRAEERIELGRRVTRWSYPPEAVREIVVNAVAHRDYTIAGADVGLFLTEAYLEIRSPGRLPNTVTIESIEAGVSRYARNQMLVNVLRDYQYIEHIGRGIAYRVIPSMLAHNGTRPILREYDETFSVTLLAG